MNRLWLKMYDTSGAVIETLAKFNIVLLLQVNVYELWFFFLIKAKRFYPDFFLSMHVS